MSNQTIQRQQLRVMVRGTYDLQKLRVMIGNRIVGNFKAKLGQEPGKPEEDIDAEGQKILADLRRRYKLLTDGVATFPRQASFRGDEVISTYTELCLIAQYVDLEDDETRHFGRLKTVLRDHPIWTSFLEGVTGCGPAMSGVIISEIDIHKAEYPSSVWSYAGLDVVTLWMLQGTTVRRTNLAKSQPVLDLPTECSALEGDGGICGEMIGHERDMQDEPKRWPDSEKARDARELAVVRFERDGYVIDACYRLFHLGGRSRKKDHLVERHYTDKDGNPAKRVGITFNPFLKTKLYVLATCFLKLPPDRCVYRQIYDDYKHRLEHMPAHADKSKGHRHAMAMRYMIKRFLADLYTHWRPLEGLPVAPEFSEGKLGIRHKAA